MIFPTLSFSWILALLSFVITNQRTLPPKTVSELDIFESAASHQAITNTSQNWQFVLNALQSNYPTRSSNDVRYLREQFHDLTTHIDLKFYSHINIYASFMRLKMCDQCAFENFRASYALSQIGQFTNVGVKFPLSKTGKIEKGEGVTHRISIRPR